MGARHTIEVQEHSPITLTKDYWDSVYISKLREIVKKDQSSKMYAVVLQEGLANICIIKNSMCLSEEPHREGDSRKGTRRERPE